MQLLIFLKAIQNGSYWEKKSNDEIGKLVDSFNGYIAKLRAGYDEDSKSYRECWPSYKKVINGFYVYKIEKTS